jgi:hypothetical protein
LAREAMKRGWCICKHVDIKALSMEPRFTSLLFRRRRNRHRASCDRLSAATSCSMPTHSPTGPLQHTCGLQTRQGTPSCQFQRVTCATAHSPRACSHCTPAMGGAFAYSQLTRMSVGWCALVSSAWIKLMRSVAAYWVVVGTAQLCCGLCSEALQHSSSRG